MSTRAHGFEPLSNTSNGPHIPLLSHETTRMHKQAEESQASLIEQQTRVIQQQTNQNENLISSMMEAGEYLVDVGSATQPVDITQEEPNGTMRYVQPERRIPGMSSPTDSFSIVDKEKQHHAELDLMTTQLKECEETLASFNLRVRLLNLDCLLLFSPELKHMLVEAEGIAQSASGDMEIAQ
eukprot:Colp12_sorted_trinity150504_noHs@5103